MRQRDNEKPFLSSPTGLAVGLARKDRATPHTRRFAPGPRNPWPYLVPPFLSGLVTGEDSALCPLTDRRHHSEVPGHDDTQTRDIRSRCAIRGHRSRRLRPQRRRPAAPRGRDPDPAGLEVRPLPRADRARARRRAAGDPRLHAARGAVAGRPRPRGPRRRLPHGRPRRPARARRRAVRPRDDHGRLPRAPRPRGGGGARGGRRPDPGRARRRRGLVAARRPHPHRRAALAGPHARAGGRARARGGRAAGAAAGRADELRGPHRRRRRPAARAAADGRRDPRHAARVLARAGAAPRCGGGGGAARSRRCASSTAAGRGRSSAPLWSPPSPRSPPARASTGRRCSTPTRASARRRPRCSRCRSCGARTVGRRRCSAAGTRPRARRGATGCRRPYLPAGLRLDRQEGAGEVQTPLRGPGAAGLRVGEWCGCGTPRRASCASGSTRCTWCGVASGSVQGADVSGRGRVFPVGPPNVAGATGDARAAGTAAASCGLFEAEPGGHRHVPHPPTTHAVDERTALHAPDPHAAPERLGALHALRLHPGPDPAGLVTRARARHERDAPAGRQRRGHAPAVGRSSSRPARRGPSAGPARRSSDAWPAPRRAPARPLRVRRARAGRQPVLIPSARSHICR